MSLGIESHTEPIRIIWLKTYSLDSCVYSPFIYSLWTWSSSSISELRSSSLKTLVCAQVVYAESTHANEAEVVNTRTWPHIEKAKRAFTRCVEASEKDVKVAVTTHVRMRKLHGTILECFHWFFFEARDPNMTPVFVHAGAAAADYIQGIGSIEIESTWSKVTKRAVYSYKH